ncbi:MAG TPA: hypothetical protein PK246_04665 [Saprospiraceae bacterium]|nr:hypothetical protein [Saprospiraceae bacterium]
MTNINNIENRLRDLSDMQSTTPPAIVWKNIENELNKKNNKLIFWICGSLFLIATIGAISYFGFGSKATNNQVEKLEYYQDVELTTESEIDITKNEVLYSDTKTSPTDNTIKTESIANSKSPTNSQIALNDYKKQFELKKNLDFNQSRLEIEDYSMANNDHDEKLEKHHEKNSPLCISIIPHYKNDHIEHHANIPVIHSVVQNEVTCPTFKKSVKISPFIEIGSSIGKPLNKFGNSTNPELLELRKTTEKSWYSWGLYVHGGLYLNRNLYFGTGIEWTQSKDKFYNEKGGLSKIIITFDPQTGNPIDTSYVTGKFISEGEVRYNSLDIPLFLGYAQTYGRWNYGLELAALLNLSFKVNGKVIDQNAQISRVETVGDIYKNNIGLGLKACIFAQYQLNNGMSLLLKPSYRQQFNEIQQSNYPIKMTWKNVGFDMGLRFNF